MNTPSNLKWAVVFLAALLITTVIGCSGEPVVEKEVVVEVVVTATAPPQVSRPDSRRRACCCRWGDNQGRIIEAHPTTAWRWVQAAVKHATVCLLPVTL